MGGLIVFRGDSFIRENPQVWQQVNGEFVHLAEFSWLNQRPQGGIGWPIWATSPVAG